jgi:RHS repeat-associated protein
LATDSSHSIIDELFDGKHSPIAYTAYGEQSAQQKDRTRLGFNGQLREAKIGWYLLGNGYRAYNPRLMRFHSPDSWSPFGEGGLNAYTYCVGDPVNRSDPTGHWGVLALLSNAREIGAIGYLTSTIGAGLNSGSLIINRGRITLANGLGMISGLTGIASGVSAMFDLAPQASQLFSTTSLISGVASTYLGTRSLRADFRHIGWYEVPFSRPSNSPPAYFNQFPLRAAGVASASPPVYPLNRSTLRPTSLGEKPPAYSRQDPALFSTPLLDADNPHKPSTHPEPMGVLGTFSSRYQAQVRKEFLDRLDGLSTSKSIRERR